MSWRQAGRWRRRAYPARPASRLRRFLDLALAAAILGLIALVSARFDRVATRQVAGEAVVNDGDTITLAGERIRLQGIDAPEYNQTCRKDGATYPCGRAAREALVRLTASGTIECAGWEHPRASCVWACGPAASIARASGASSMAAWQKASTISSAASSTGSPRSSASHKGRLVLALGEETG